MWLGVADVILTDGITGNIILKSSEGLAKLFMQTLFPGRKSDNSGNPVMSRFDPSSYGGAPLLGVQRVCIACHGNSQEKEIFNAIQVAKNCLQCSLPEKISHFLKDSPNSKMFQWKRGKIE